MRATSNIPPPQQRFIFLETLQSDMYRLASEAEENLTRQPTFAAVQLRSFAERLVNEVIKATGAPVMADSRFFERIKLLQGEELLQEGLAGRLHKIRIMGNKAAHGDDLSSEEVAHRLRDAHLLAKWFAYFIEPTKNWAQLYPDSFSVETAAKTEPQTSPEPPQPPISKRPPSFISPHHQLAAARATALLSPEERKPTIKSSLLQYLDMTPTDDQRACLFAIEEFLNAPEQKVFLLKGYAGTGKTTLLKAVADYLSVEEVSFGLTAPTGRAAKVLSEKTKYPACTIHLQIYRHEADLIPPKKEEDDDEEDNLAPIMTIFSIISDEESKPTVLIADESSLIGNIRSKSLELQMGTGALLDDLITYLGLESSLSSRKLILVGDPAQLPPVKMNFSPALDKAYLRRTYDLDAQEAELKQTVRQIGDDALITNVKALRNRELSLNGRLTLKYDSRISKLSADRFKTVYSELLNQLDIADFIVIARTNAFAKSYNRTVRSLLFPGAPLIARGERLMITANTAIDGWFLANGELVGVTAVSEKVERRTVPVRARKHEKRGNQVELVFREVEIEAPTPDGKFVLAKVQILESNLSSLYEEDKTALIATAEGHRALTSQALRIDFNNRHQDLRLRNNKEEYIKILRSDPYYNALRVQYGYAVTCHKAQGGEWEHVIVDAEGIKSVNNEYAFRWMYTALTRTRKNIQIINAPEDRVQILDNSVYKQLSTFKQGSPAPSYVPSGSGTSSESPGTTLPIPESRTGLEPKTTLTDTSREDVKAEPTTSIAVEQKPQSGNFSPTSDSELVELLRTRIQILLDGSGLGIEDLRHHNYHFVLKVSNETEIGQLRLFYNGKKVFTKLDSLSPVADLAQKRLSSFVGSSLTDLNSPIPPSKQTPSSAVPSEVALHSLHHHLLKEMDDKKIVTALDREMPYRLRYSFARGDERAQVDFNYNKRGRVTPEIQSANSAPFRDELSFLLGKILQSS